MPRSASASPPRAASTAQAAAPSDLAPPGPAGTSGGGGGQPSRSPATGTRGGSASSATTSTSHADRVAALRGGHAAGHPTSTSSQSYSSNDQSSSQSQSHSRSFFAPTPYNTYIDGSDDIDPGKPDAHSPTQTQGSVFVGAPTDSFLDADADTDEAYTYQRRHSPGDVSVGPTLSPASSRSRHYPFDDVPQSSRPVPAPPQHVSTIHSTSDNSELVPVVSQQTTRSISTPAPSMSQRNLGLKGYFRRGSRSTVVDRDTLRLQQLGYDAVLGRDFTFWSSLSIAWLNINSVQGTIGAVVGTYRCGGPVMIMIAWPISGVLSLALVFTMSELASAYPVAGAMSSWAWKLARGGVGGERYWGWVVGAFVLGGHIGNLVFVSWQNVNQITGVMALAVDYHVKDWHKFLFMLALVVVVGGVGATAWGSSSRYWLGAGAYTFGVWLCLCIALLVKGVPHRDYSEAPPISTAFFNQTGFSQRGLVYMLGWQSCTIAAGADVSAHLSEETQNPSRNVPNAMTMSIVVTYVLGYISIVLVLVSVMPSDVMHVASQHSPVAHILSAAVNPHFAIVQTSLMVVVLCLQLQAQLQAASRFVFASARDRAMPFSDTIKATNDKKQPWVATLVCIGLWAPWCLLQFANQANVFPVIIAITATLSMLSYALPVFLYLVSNKDLQSEGRTSWSLRRWSRPVAVVGLLFCCAVITMQIFPTRSPVTVDSISWSPVVVAGTLLISVVTWKLYGSRHYSGPIRALTKWETGVELDIDSTLQASTRGAAAAPTTNGGSSETSLKLAVTPCYDDVRAVNTVTVNSASTVDSLTSGGEWAAAPFTTTGGDGDVARDLGLSFSSGSGTGTGSGSRGSAPTVSFALGPPDIMGRVDEEDAEGGATPPRSPGTGQRPTGGSQSGITPSGGPRSPPLGPRGRASSR